MLYCLWVLWFFWSQFVLAAVAGKGWEHVGIKASSALITHEMWSDLNLFHSSGPTQWDQSNNKPTAALHSIVTGSSAFLSTILLYCLSDWISYYKRTGLKTTQVEYVEKDKMAHITKCSSALYKYYLAVTVGFCETPRCSSRGTDWTGSMRYLRS